MSCGCHPMKGQRPLIRCAGDERPRDAAFPEDVQDRIGREALPLGAVVMDMRIEDRQPLGRCRGRRKNPDPGEQGCENGSVQADGRENIPSAVPPGNDRHGSDFPFRAGLLNHGSLHPRGFTVGRVEVRFPVEDAEEPVLP